MNKGDLLTSNTTNSIWNVTKGETLIALSDERYRNGEFEIKTSKGWIPSVFFYNIDNLGNFTIL